MALSEQEEFELLSLERERAMGGGGAPVPAGRQIVEPNALQRFAGISKNRYKDENLAGNVGRGVLSLGEDFGREATLLATGMGASPGVANTAGFLGEAATFLPMTGGSAVAGKAAGPVMEEGAKKIMQSALKPSVASLTNKGATGVNADRAIQTMLEKGYNVSRGGIKSMRADVEDLSKSITETLQNSGATVDKNVVAGRLQDLITEIKRLDLHPQERVAAVQKIYNEVLSGTDIPRHIPVERANQIKQAIYRKISDQYGELGSDAVEAEKALARGIKEDISRAHPEVAQLNKEESDILNALVLAQHRAFITGNKDIAGIGWLIQHPMAFATFMADRSPLFKSIIARMLYKGSDAPALAAPAITAGAITPGKEQGR